MSEGTSQSENLFDLLEDRGFIAQTTGSDEIRETMGKGPVVGYIGFDPTAGSLHVGHLVQAIVLRHLQNTGHKPIALLGGGTALVGDPSGKSEMRKMLEQEHIDANTASFAKQLGRVVDIEGGKCLLENNADWLRGLGYIDFLRDVGRHFSVNRMLSMEAYKQRLERGLSFIEFNYQLLQAYDFVELYRRHGCTLQLGGDDQWGNILAGVDLGRRLEQAQLYGLTIPLLLTSDGKKMGKTEKGAVWIDETLVSPFEFYQYWVNVDDLDVHKLLARMTFLPMPEIRALSAEGGPELNMAKSILAYEVTALVHGKHKADEAHQGALSGFGAKEIPAGMLPSSAVPRKAEVNLDTLPTTELAAADIAEGLGLLRAMVTGRLASSNGEARRFVQQGAVKVNDQKVDDPASSLAEADFVDGELIIRVGKKKLHRYLLT